MTSTVLVVTTVHHPDDNRIREKTVRTLATTHEVIYATRTPGPVDRSGLAWEQLPGGRIRRNVSAWRLALTSRYESLSIHDPELLPLGMVVRLVRRRRVVFDMHEDVPAQILAKSWVPPLLRGPLAAAVHVLLRLAERIVVFTVAEESYLDRLGRVHPVISNYPDVDVLPWADTAQPSGAVYVGDVTEERGLVEAVRACAEVGVPLVIVGRVDDGLRARLEAEAGSAGVRLTGRLPHGEAMRVVASAAVALSPLRDLPNYRRSIPTKVLEYLAIGVPVVASDLPATRELVAGLEAVSLHRPGDAGDLARCLDQALAPGVSASARDQASEVRARFRWPTERLLEVYRPR